MAEIYSLMLDNLKNAGIGISLFFLAYLSNVCFSLYYNIKILGKAFDKEQMWNSILKVVTFIIGCSCLVIVVTGIPLFANQMGLPLPEEFTNNLTMVSILGFPLYAAIKFGIMAMEKMKMVLEAGTITLKEIEGFVPENKNQETKIQEGVVEEVEENEIEKEKINKEVGTIEEETEQLIDYPETPNFENMEYQQIVTEEESK